MYLFVSSLKLLTPGRAFSFSVLEGKKGRLCSLARRDRTQKQGQGTRLEWVWDGKDN